MHACTHTHTHTHTHNHTHTHTHHTTPTHTHTPHTHTHTHTHTHKHTQINHELSLTEKNWKQINLEKIEKKLADRWYITAVEWR